MDYPILVCDADRPSTALRSPLVSTYESHPDLLLSGLKKNSIDY